jgi:hypothetical protein
VKIGLVYLQTVFRQCGEEAPPAGIVVVHSYGGLHVADFLVSEPAQVVPRLESALAVIHDDEIGIKCLETRIQYNQVRLQPDGGADLLRIQIGAEPDVSAGAAVSQIFVQVPLNILHIDGRIHQRVSAAAALLLQDAEQLHEEGLLGVLLENDARIGEGDEPERVAHPADLLRFAHAPRQIAGLLDDSQNFFSRLLTDPRFPAKGYGSFSLPFELENFNVGRPGRPIPDCFTRITKKIYEYR